MSISAVRSAIQANVVRVLADQPGNRGSRLLFTDPDEHQAITELLAAGTLGEWEDTLAISADAAFSLYERYRPSSILTAMSQSDDAHGLTEVTFPVHSDVAPQDSFSTMNDRSITHHRSITHLM